MVTSGQERRKYLRVGIPLSLRVIYKDNSISQTTSKDVSPLGLRFEVKDKDVEVNDDVELKIELPGIPSAVHAKAKIVWKKKLAAEKTAPFDVGCEFTKVEEDNKNTFLKYFCDLLYQQAKKAGEKDE